jgi:hypothetical protein
MRALLRKIILWALTVDSTTTSYAAELDALAKQLKG